MSTLNVNTINAATSGQGVAVDLQNPKSFRNLIINGAMNVAQRGTSTTTTNTLCVDRFKCFFGGHDEAPTFAQHALTSSDTGPWAKGFRNSLQITNGNQTGGAGATDECSIYHQIEAQNLAGSGWDYTSASSKATLSFWIKSSVAQNFHGYLVTDDGTQMMYRFSTGSLTADTWTKVTKTIPGHASLQFNEDNGVGLGISFGAFFGTDYTASGLSEGDWNTWNGAQRNNDNTSTWWTTNDATFEITGVQLELGDVATDYEHRSYGDELARSQRYYQGFTAEFREDDSADGTIFFGTLGLPVKMRSAPTITSSYASSYNVNTGASLEDSHIDPQAICFGHRASGAGTRARRTIGLSSEL